jgi:hypothetical protein
MHRPLVLLLTLTLAGCGLESAGTAATAAALKAKEAKQGQETKEQVVKQLDAAGRLAEQQQKAMKDAENK